MELYCVQTPFNLELPPSPAAYEERVGGSGVQLEKQQIKIKKVKALDLRRHTHRGFTQQRPLRQRLLV